MARCCGSFFAKCKERGGSSLSPYALSARYKLLNLFLGFARLVRCVRRHKKSDGVWDFGIGHVTFVINRGPCIRADGQDRRYPALLKGHASC